MADEKFVKAVNKISSQLDRLLKADFIGRDDFSALLSNADAVATHSQYGKHIKHDLDYLWKTFEHEFERYINRGGDVSGFNAEFLVNKLRDYWINFTRRISEDEGGNDMSVVKEREDRMSALLTINEEKRYAPQSALDHVRMLHDQIRDLAGYISKSKVIAIDYENASKSATIERLYKQLSDEIYSLEEALILEVEKEEKKVKKAEQELDQVEEPEEPFEPSVTGEEDIDVGDEEI